MIEIEIVMKMHYFSFLVAKIDGLGNIPIFAKFTTFENFLIIHKVNSIYGHRNKANRIGFQGNNV